MPLPIQCPTCGKQAHVPYEAAGKLLICTCGAKFRVPNASLAEEPWCSPETDFPSSAKPQTLPPIWLKSLTQHLPQSIGKTPTPVLAILSLAAGCVFVLAAVIVSRLLMMMMGSPSPPPKDYLVTTLTRVEAVNSFSTRGMFGSNQETSSPAILINVEIKNESSTIRYRSAGWPTLSMISDEFGNRYHLLSDNLTDRPSSPLSYLDPGETYRDAFALEPPIRKAKKLGFWLEDRFSAENAPPHPQKTAFEISLDDVAEGKGLDK